MFILSTADPLVRLNFTSMREGRSESTISSPSHILLIFSSKPPQNPRPSNIFLSVLSSKIKFFKK